MNGGSVGYLFGSEFGGELSAFEELPGALWLLLVNGGF